MRNRIFSAIVIFITLYNSQATADSVACYNMRERISGAINECANDLLANPAGEARPELVMNTATQGRINCVHSNGSFREGQAFIVSCSPYIVPPPSKPETNPNSCPASGSIIQAANQVLGETIPLTGSSFDLVYFSNKVIGRSADYIVNLPLTNAEVPTAVHGYNVEIKNEVGTIIDNATYVAVPNLTHVYQWNGIDSGSNETWGLVKRIVTVNEDASDYTFPPTPREIYVGNIKAKKLGTGGWLPSIWHFYDIASGTLFKGNGDFRKVAATLVGGQYRVADTTGKEVYYFDSVGKIVETRTGLTGKSIYSFAYDSAGRISTITESFNRVTTFNRYLTGGLKAIITPNGTKTTITINNNGYLTSATNPNSENFTMTYNGVGGLLTSFTTPSGAVTTLTYDSVGNLTSDTNSSGKSSTLAKTSSGVTLTSAMGRVTGNAYDYYSKKEVTANSSGFPVNQTTRDDQDLIESPSSSYTANYITPDPRFGTQVHLPSSTTNIDFGSRNIQYIKTATLNDSNDVFSINTLTEITRSLPSEVTSIYTGLDRKKVTTTKLGKTQTVQFDEYERPVLTQAGTLAATYYTYTNNLLTKKIQGSRSTNYIYYANNLLKKIKNDLGQFTAYTYDAARRLQSMTLPDLRVINYSYDTNGNVTSITPPGKPLHQIEYDIDGQISNYLPPMLANVPTANTEYTYNNDRQLTKITRPDGAEINYNYNTTSGLLTSVTGSNLDSITRTYSQGRPDNISQGGQAIYMGYNGSMISFTQATSNLGASIYRFDRNPSSVYGGRIGQDKITSFFDFSQKIINYEYDNDEYLTKAGDLVLSYNANGNLAGTSLSQINDTYYYNKFGEVRKYVVKNNLNVIYKYELVRDTLGRITKKTEKLNNVLTVFDYVYDAAGRLIQVSKNGIINSTYEYDSNSNRIGGVIRGESIAATYDEQDRLLTYNDKSLSYNANGELLTNGAAAFTYDSLGNLKNYSKDTTTLSYEIDPLQRRSGQIVNGSLSSRYAYNPNGQVIAQMDANNKILKTFVYATKSHVPDYYIDVDNNKFRIISDNLGSVRLVVSDTGSVLQVMEHDEFGKVLQDTNPGFLPFGFAGGLYDYRTGLVRFGVRDYDPETGRWLSKDPLKFAANDTNLYGYVMSDPVNFIDPTGLINWTQVGAGTVQFVIGGGVTVGGVTLGGLITGGSGFLGTTVGVGIGVGSVFYGYDLYSDGLNKIIDGFKDEKKSCPLNGN